MTATKDSPDLKSLRASVLKSHFLGGFKYFGFTSESWQSNYHKAVSSHSVNKETDSGEDKSGLVDSSLTSESDCRQGKKKSF